MYVREKLSAMQIAQKLQTTPSGVAYYLRKNGVKKRSISDAITELHKTKFSKTPFALKKKLTSKDKFLKVSGVMLYWGEGNKEGGTVRFTNSNPRMIKVFVSFLREVCGIDEERLKALVHIYPDQNYKRLKRFWSTTTNIPTKNFYKPNIHNGARKGTYKRKSEYGTLAVSYSDKKLLEQINLWIWEYGNLFG